MFPKIREYTKSFDENKYKINKEIKIWDVKDKIINRINKKFDGKSVYN